MSAAPWRLELLLRRQPKPGRALFVDMNSFFASVEQQIKPGLRGKPVGICPFVHSSTCVIAASTEAKRYGVKTGTSVTKARQLCPDIHLISDDPSVYRHYHRLIMQKLTQTRCQVSIKSIDEALLEVPSDLQPAVLDLASSVKQRIYEVGSNLSCSIGISSNLFLAKMGSGLQKPNGLVQIGLGDLEAFYETLRLNDLHGISWRLSRRLRAMGIKTPLELYHAPYQKLKQAFGVNGERWYLRLRGYEVDQRPTTRRMIGHQTTLPQPALTRQEVLSVASQLCYKAAYRLRAADLAAQSVYVGVRFTDRTYWGRMLRTHTPFWDSATFMQHVTKAFGSWQPPKPVRLVTVTSCDLTPKSSITRSLFDTPIKNQALSQALDEIYSRWGRQSITPGTHLLTKPVTDRIGFGNAHQMAAVLK